MTLTCYYVTALSIPFYLIESGNYTLTKWSFTFNLTQKWSSNGNHGTNHCSNMKDKNDKQIHLYSWVLSSGIQWNLPKGKRIVLLDTNTRHEQIPWYWNTSALVGQITTRLLPGLNPGPQCPLAPEIMRLSLSDCIPSNVNDPRSNDDANFGRSHEVCTGVTRKIRPGTILHFHLINRHRFSSNIPWLEK